MVKFGTFVGQWLNKFDFYFIAYYIYTCRMSVKAKNRGFVYAKSGTEKCQKKK